MDINSGHKTKEILQDSQVEVYVSTCHYQLFIFNQA